MKTIGLIIAMLLSGAAIAQKKDIREKEVPSAVFQAFTQKYPEAKTRTWKTKNDEYEVDFYVSMKKYEAKLEADGKWKKTSYKVTERDIPSAVTGAFKASEFAGWSMEDGYSVETPEAKNLVMLKVTRSKDTMELLYSATGDLIKAKKKTE